MKTSDKRLRALLRDCEIRGKWRHLSGGYQAGSVADENERVAHVYGSVDDVLLHFSRAELIALAPDLAKEVLELRREVRRLRKQVP